MMSGKAIEILTLAASPKLKERASQKARFSEDLIQDCLQILAGEEPDDLFEIIPRIGVLRDSRFNRPLLHLLRSNDMRCRVFAAYAMGAMGSEEFLEPLKAAFESAAKLPDRSGDELLLATAEAIGALGDEAAVDFFLPILRGTAADYRVGKRLWKPMVEAIGAIAQQGGTRSVMALVELTHHKVAELRASSISELSVAFWHRPNEIPDTTLHRIHDLTRDPSPSVAESALSALQSLADVGCHRAEKLFSRRRSG